MVDRDHYALLYNADDISTRIEWRDGDIINDLKIHEKIKTAARFK